MIFARPDCPFTPIVGLAPTRAGSHHRYAPGFLRSLLPCMPAQVPNAPGAHNRSTVRRFQTKRRVRRMRQAGQPAQRFRRNKLRLAAQLHRAHHRRQVHVAAALARAQQRALHLHRPGQNRRARIGDAQPPVRVPMKSELRLPDNSAAARRSPRPLLPDSRRPSYRTQQSGSPSGARTAQSSA